MNDATIRHGDITYVTIPLDSCLDTAKSLADKGRKWHSHVLSPGCAHNPFADGYAIIIEDDEEDITYIAASEGFPEVDKALVRMLHGDDILDDTKSAGEKGEIVAGSKLLQRLIEIDGAGHHWHHHMNFPDCVFNPHRGQWAITIESDAGTFSEAYEDEPVDVLREVEVIYFRNLAAKSP